MKPAPISFPEYACSPGHFLRIRQWVGGGGGHLQKGTILYQVWRNDRWLLVTKSLVWYRCGIATPMTAIPAFPETDFWTYGITLCCR